MFYGYATVVSVGRSPHDESENVRRLRRRTKEEPRNVKLRSADNVTDGKCSEVRRRSVRI